MHIILIHLGNKKVKYINSCIEQILKFNKKINIHFLSNRNSWKYIKFNFKKKIIFHNYEELELSENHKKFIKINNFDNKWYCGFWLHTTERFFYLEDLISKYKLKNVIHIENDCLIYFKIKNFIQIFKKNFNISFLPEASKKVIPVIIYLQNNKSIFELNKFILNELNMLKFINFFYFNKKKINDMFLLYKFFKINYKKKKNIKFTNN